MAKIVFVSKMKKNKIAELQLPAFEKWRMFSTKSKDPLEARLKMRNKYCYGLK